MFRTFRGNMQEERDPYDVDCCTAPPVLDLPLKLELPLQPVLDLGLKFFDLDTKTRLPKSVKWEEHKKLKRKIRFLVAYGEHFPNKWFHSETLQVIGDCTGPLTNALLVSDQSHVALANATLSRPKKCRLIKSKRTQKCPTPQSCPCARV
jgi:hypothetical protein